MRRNSKKGKERERKDKMISTKYKGNQHDSKKSNYIFTLIQGILIIMVLALLPIFLYECYKLKMAKNEFDNIPTLIEESSTKDLPINTAKPEDWPKDALFVAKERAEYKSGELRLVIPKIDLDEAIIDGTSASALKQGPGLYEYSQMPGEGDRNVSIAGHRAGYSKYANIFRNIHTIEEDDYMYLIDDANVYQYLYKGTKIVNPEEWSVIYLQGFSCLTLTSCNPIGDNYERIIVTGELISIEPYTKDYIFLDHRDN